jgi:hypothetical protein
MKRLWRMLFGAVLLGGAAAAQAAEPITTASAWS